jgi:hypothetical protein
MLDFIHCIYDAFHIPILTFQCNLLSSFFCLNRKFVVKLIKFLFVSWKIISLFDCFGGWRGVGVKFEVLHNKVLKAFLDYRAAFESFWKVKLKFVEVFFVCGSSEKLETSCRCFQRFLAE